MRILKWLHSVADYEIMLTQVSCLFNPQGKQMEMAMRASKIFPRKYHEHFYGYLQENAKLMDSFPIILASAIRHTLFHIEDEEKRE